MFSQFRNAVEQLAQPIRDAASHEDHSNQPPSRSGSLDIQAARSASPLSSSELADSALSSPPQVARRAAQWLRAAFPKRPHPPVPVENGRPRKSNLEERLRRAAFAIGDVSTAPGTTNRSSRVGSPFPNKFRSKTYATQGPRAPCSFNTTPSFSYGFGDVRGWR